MNVTVNPFLVLLGWQIILVGAAMRTTEFVMRSSDPMRCVWFQELFLPETVPKQAL